MKTRLAAIALALSGVATFADDFKMEKRKLNPTQEMIIEAKQNPNGWVYEIDARYDKDGRVPPEGIKGAWKVDANGELTGEYTPNPNYKAE